MSQNTGFLYRFKISGKNGYPTQEQLEKIYKRKDGGRL